MVALALALHALGAAIWVGGMFFAYVALRPSLEELEPSVRLSLLRCTFRRFFAWVIASIAVILVSGYGLLFGVHGGFGGAGIHIHVMHLVGLIMVLLFLHLFFVPWRRFRAAVTGGENALAARWLGQMRLIIAINLALGLLTIAVGSSGRYW